MRYFHPGLFICMECVILCVSLKPHHNLFKKVRHMVSISAKEGVERSDRPGFNPDWSN
jgi:hypothetical protein